MLPILAALVLVGCLGTPTAGLSQQAVSRKDVSAKALNDFEAGVQAAFKGDDRYAIRYFESAIKREPNFAEAIVELSGIYYNRGDYAEAENYLEQVSRLEGRDGARAYYGLAMAELKQGKHAEALTHLDAYLSLDGLRPDRIAAAERYRAEAKFRAEALKSAVDLDLRRLPSTVNTSDQAEYLPALTADGNTMVFTRRVGNRQEDFYLSQRDDSGNWTEALPLTGVNTLENEGAQTVSADGKLLIFTACNREDGIGSCDLYFSVREGDDWTTPQNLGAPVNTKAWESQPSLAANGNLLFFASRRNGGEGKADLYACGRTPEGGWTEPVNLGPKVNTPNDDQAPFFHSDGRTLYFMSNGHPGMGQFDLFLTRLADDNTWTEPSNLGYPINTEGNEGAIAVTIDGKTAYFATDAEVTAQDSMGVGSARGLTTDLYVFTLPEASRAGVVTYVKATVVDDATNAPIAASALFTDEAADKPYLRRRADASTGSFLAVLPSGKTYTLAVEEPGYLFYSDRFELNEPADATQPYELEIRLQKLAPAVVDNEVPPSAKPIVLRNVLFETASAELLPASRTELDRLRTLLENNPTIRIRIQGHTDDVGEENDNQQLSQRRAAAVLAYLSEAGIEASRLESTGFGESRPLLPNTDDAARAVNRRTEFVVL